MDTTPETARESATDAATPTPLQSHNPDHQATLLRGGFGSRLRQHTRREADDDVFLSHANGTGALLARGNCLDISRGGLRAEFDNPCAVGDVVQVYVSKGDGSNSEPRFARCLRCAVATDGRYEASFQFLVPVELPRLGR